MFRYWPVWTLQEDLCSGIGRRAKHKPSCSTTQLCSGRGPVVWIMTVKLDAFIRLSTILCKRVRSELVSSGTENAKHYERYGPSYACESHWWLMVGKRKKLCVGKIMKDAKLLCKGNYCHKEEYLCFVFMFDNLVNMCCL